MVGFGSIGRTLGLISQTCTVCCQRMSQHTASGTGAAKVPTGGTGGSTLGDDIYPYTNHASPPLCRKIIGHSSSRTSCDSERV